MGQHTQTGLSSSAGMNRRLDNWGTLPFRNTHRYSRRGRAARWLGGAGQGRAHKVPARQQTLHQPMRSANYPISWALLPLAKGPTPTHLGSERISILLPSRRVTTMSPHAPTPRPMLTTEVTSSYAASSCSSAEGGGRGGGGAGESNEPGKRQGKQGRRQAGGTGAEVLSARQGGSAVCLLHCAPSLLQQSPSCSRSAAWVGLLLNHCIQHMLHRFQLPSLCSSDNSSAPLQVLHARSVAPAARRL